jgi:hypothetical protein
MHGLAPQSSCVSRHATVLCQSKRQLQPSKDQHLPPHGGPRLSGCQQNTSWCNTALQAWPQPSHTCPSRTARWPCCLVRGPELTCLHTTRPTKLPGLHVAVGSLASIRSSVKRQRSVSARPSVTAGISKAHRRSRGRARPCRAAAAACGCPGPAALSPPRLAQRLRGRAARRASTCAWLAAAAEPAAPGTQARAAVSPDAVGRSAHAAPHTSQAAALLSALPLQTGQARLQLRVPRGQLWQQVCTGQHAGVHS